MEIGPLEYVVLGFEDGQFASVVLPKLNEIQESGLIRVVDLLFVGKAADGAVSMQEVSELGEDEQAAYAGLAEDVAGLLTAEDIDRLASEIPPGTWAVVALFEHTWTLQLADAVRRAGGALFAGGMVAPDAIGKVSAELAAAKEEHHA
ncbi:MAG TPA: DUF6325 family protein [Ktedonobacteraceae bacterium]|nr:DUF6325 family protein [Ktedonobacteraceae bacterium]